MPAVWDHKADKDLLLSIIEEGALKSIQWANVANRLIAKGYSFSQEACRQHFQKIRKESRGGPASTAGSNTSTPRKPSNQTPKGSKGNGNSKFASFGHDNQDDEEEFIKTPSKKRKVEKMEDEDLQTAAIFKLEEKDENGYIHLDIDDEDLYDA